MRHAILTCKNHPELRWNTKICAVDKNAKPGEPARYDSSRNIFFNGWNTTDPPTPYPDKSGFETSIMRGEGDSVEFARECDCPASLLIIAPEDPEVRR